MILVIGGFSQGKLEYTKEKYDIADERVFDSLPDGNETDLKRGEPFILNDINIWFRNRLEEGIGDPADELAAFIDRHPETIVISSEIGSGIIPLDRDERTYRELTGRLQVRLAGKALEVIRVVCGIGMKIK